MFTAVFFFAPIQVVDEFGEALWIDSGNKAMEGKLDMKFIRNDLIGPTGFYSPKSQNTPFHWVHAGKSAPHIQWLFFGGGGGVKENPRKGKGMETVLIFAAAAVGTRRDI